MSVPPGSLSRILYIVADDRSGSTLLQSLLGLQPGCFAVGEVRRVGPLSREGRPCGCGALVRECPFWTAIGAAMGAPFERTLTAAEFGWRRQWLGWTIEELAFRIGLPRLADALLRTEARAARNCLRIHTLVSEKTGCRLVVDSSKSLGHFYHLYVQAPERVVPLFLVRDGRGVVWSKLNWSPTDPRVAIRSWVRTARMQLMLRDLVPEEWRRLVRYEELCGDPAGTIASVLGPIGASVGVASTDLGGLAGRRHDLGGSPRFQTLPGSIELDERWKTEMPEELRRAFDWTAGEVNRLLGYE